MRGRATGCRTAERRGDRRGRRGRSRAWRGHGEDVAWRGRVLAETEECHLLGCEVLRAIGRERAYCWDAGGPFGDWPLRSACCIYGNLTKKIWPWEALFWAQTADALRASSLFRHAH